MAYVSRKGIGSLLSRFGGDLEVGAGCSAEGYYAAVTLDHSVLELYSSSYPLSMSFSTRLSIASSSVSPVDE